MMYFFCNETPNESIFELAKAQEAPKVQAFDRYYLDSDTVIERRSGLTFLKGPKGKKQFTEDVAECFSSVIKLHFKGNRYELKDAVLLELTLPWKVKVLLTNVLEGKFISYPGTITSYFYQRTIGIFAGPGTGKTCLARALSNYFSINLGISCDNCYEYATTHIARHGPPTFEDQAEILFRQWSREQDIRNTKQITISDCPHPLSYLYAVKLYQQENRVNSRHLLWLAERAVANLDQFDTKIYLPPNRDRCVKDGIRLHDFEQSKEIGGRIKQFLDENNCKYLTYENESLDALIGRILSLNHLCTNK